MNNYKKLSDFEKDLINYIITIDRFNYPVNVSDLRVNNREDNEFGFYTYFNEMNCHKKEMVNKTLGKSVFIDLPQRSHGAGCMLYIDDGLISMLEVYSHAKEPIFFKEKNYNFAT